MAGDLPKEMTVAIPYIFRKKQTVKWSDFAFKSMGKENIKIWYGLDPFKVLRTQRSANPQQTQHPQLITIRCNDQCNRPTFCRGSVEKCSGKCDITLSGAFFKPNGKKKKSRKRSKKNKRG